MEAADDQRPQPQLEMPQHDKAFAAVAVDETATTTSSKMKQLSDESDAGEPEENYRGWKAMPYVIGELSIYIYIHIYFLLLPFIKDVFNLHFSKSKDDLWFDQSYYI